MVLPTAQHRSFAVGRLSVHSAGDPVRLRLGAGRLLDAADLVGGRVPPGAILVVRRLTDPLPGCVDITGALPSRRWEHSVRAAVSGLVDHAARPADGAVDEQAAAVLFADRAELLACAARELLLAGVLLSWWWQRLGVRTLGDVVSELAADPALVPAVVTTLHRQGLAGHLVITIAPSVAVALARSVAQAHGVAGLAEAVLPEGVGDSDPAGSTGHQDDSAHSEPRRWAATTTALLDGGTELVQEQRALLAVALALGEPRTKRLVDRVAELARPLAVASETSDATPTRDEQSRADDTRAQLEAAAERSEAQPARRAPTASAVGSPEVRTSREEEQARQAGRSPSTRVEVVGDRADNDSMDRAWTTAHLPLARRVVTTRLGGLFHLVQTGQALGLYGDFASPASPGIPLPVWDFVTLLGQELDVGVRRDPAWDLLAGLAGRDPAHPAGLGYRPPRTWRVPPSWLEPWGSSGRWQIGTVAGRDQVVHPRGFVVVEGPRLDLARERARYGCADPAPLRTTPHDPPATARDRWVAHLAAYLRVRWAAAMGVPPRRAARLLLRRPARVSVTLSRIDVSSELADLPIEVRLAGLDRDVGFVPAAGRSLWFHFS